MSILFYIIYRVVIVVVELFSIYYGASRVGSPG